MKNRVWTLWQVITSSVLGAIAVTVLSLQGEHASVIETILIFFSSSAFLFLVFFSTAKLFNVCFRRWDSSNKE